MRVALCSSTISELWQHIIRSPVRRAAEISASVEIGRPRRRPAAGRRAAAGARRSPPSSGSAPATVAARLPGAAPARPGRHRRPQRHPGAAPPAGRRPPRRAASRAAARRPSTCPRASPTPAAARRSARTCAALAADSGPPVGYADAGVLPELVEAGPRPAARRRRAGARRLTVTAGALDGIERLLAAHLRPGDAVGGRGPGLGQPARPASPRSGLRAGRRAGRRRRADRGRAAPRRSPPERGRVVVTSRAQNPTGAAVSAGPAPGAAAAARRPRRPAVIEDDHAAELADVPAAPAGRRRRDRGRSSARCPSPTARTCGWRCWPATRRRSPGSSRPDAARRRLGLHRAATPGRSRCGATRRWPRAVDAAARAYAQRRAGAAAPRWPRGA